jgi:hypothetical protein
MIPFQKNETKINGCKEEDNRFAILPHYVRINPKNYTSYSTYTKSINARKCNKNGIV